MPLISSLGVMNAINLGLASSGNKTLPISTVAVYSGSYQNFNAYPWSTSGFGTQFSAPSTIIPSSGNQCSFNPAKNALGVAHNTAPFVAIYNFSRSTGFGTKFANPSILPSSSTYGVGFAFSNDGSAVAIGTDTSPYINVYNWSNGFGAKITDPATLPAGLVYSIKFNATSSLLAMSHNNDALVAVYPWSGNTFGTKFSNPAAIPSGSGGSDLCFNSSSSIIALSISNSSTFSNVLYVYDWSNGFGTRYTNPTFANNNNYSCGITFSKSDAALIFSTASASNAISPNPDVLSAYRWIGGFGTQYAGMISPPPATSYGKVNIDSSGKYVGLAFNGSSGGIPYSSGMAYEWNDSTGFGTMYRAPSGGGSGIGFCFN